MDARDTSGAAETKAFHTTAVLSVVTGRLIAPAGCDGNGIDGVYEVLSWMAGESVYTHQIGRFAQEALPVILAARPDLSKTIDEAKTMTADNWQEFRDRWIERYGETIEVPKMSEDDHERIDPLSELAERVHPDRIVVVGAEDAE